MSTNDSFIKKWSTTPAANGTAPNVAPFGWEEGMAPSAVNDTARQQMADHRYQWQDAEWFCWGHTVSRASATSFKIATDVTAEYLANRRIKIFDSATAYATILSSSYSAPDTTINLQFDDSEDSLSTGSAFSAVALSILRPTNTAIPRTHTQEKNFVIGGNFDTNPWQRGTSFTGLTAGNAQFTADRFYANIGCAGVASVLKTADAPTIAQCGMLVNNCLHVDVTTLDGTVGAGDAAYISYYIEGYDFAQLAQRTFTISFWHKHTKTGVYCVAVSNSGSDRSYIAEYNQISSGAWEKTVVTIPASPSAGTWNYTNGLGLAVIFSLMIGTDLHGAAGSWLSTNDIATSNQVNAFDSTSNDCKFALVQIEEGTLATPFETELESEVIVKCKRYYQKSFQLSVAPAQNTADYVGAVYYRGQVAAHDFAVNVQFCPPMRATPTFTTYNPGAANANWRDTTAAADRTVTVGGALGETGVNITGAAGAATGTNFIHWSASAELV